MTPRYPPEAARSMLKQLYGDPSRDRMTPHDRVAAAVDRRVPDRVPFDFWGVPAMKQKLQTYLKAEDEEELLQLLGVDIRIVAPDYIGPEPKTLPDGTFFTQMGARKRKIENEFGVHEEYVCYPLADCQTVAEVNAWEGWPRTEYWDWASAVPKIQQFNRHVPYYMRFHIGGIFEYSWTVYGLQNFLTALYDKPEIPCAIMDGFTDLFIANIHNLMRHAEGMVDMVFTFDDVATQNSLMISPAMWRKYILPRHQRMDAAARQYGIKIMYHSCGAVYPLIGQLVKDLGIDLLNPLQPRAAGMDLARIKREFGDRIAFHGGIDLQQTMPYGTPDEVQSEVEERCRVMGAGGGYICATTHYIQMDTPLDNIIAMYTAPR